MQHVLGLDHVIILVRDLDDADGAHGEARLPADAARLPLGAHGHRQRHGDAAQRHLFRDPHGPARRRPRTQATRAVLAEREGPFGLAFKTDDARGAAAEFEAAGIAVGGALDFVRPVELPGGTQDARFTVARTRDRRDPGRDRCSCASTTRPDVVWRADYLDQPNGALGLAEVIGVADDLGQIEAGVSADLRRSGPAHRRPGRHRRRRRQDHVPFAGRVRPAVRRAGRAREQPETAPCGLARSGARPSMRSSMCCCRTACHGREATSRACWSRPTPAAAPCSSSRSEALSSPARARCRTPPRAPVAPACGRSWRRPTAGSPRPAGCGAGGHRPGRCRGSTA